MPAQEFGNVLPTSAFDKEAELQSCHGDHMALRPEVCFMWPYEQTLLTPAPEWRRQGEGGIPGRQPEPQKRPVWVHKSLGPGFSVSVRLQAELRTITLNVISN